MFNFIQLRYREVLSGREKRTLLLSCKRINLHFNLNLKLKESGAFDKWGGAHFDQKRDVYEDNIEHLISVISKAKKIFQGFYRVFFLFFWGGGWNKTILYIRTKIPLHYNNIFDKVFANFPPHWIAVDKLKLRNQYGQSLQHELAIARLNWVVWKVNLNKN